MTKEEAIKRIKDWNLDDDDMEVLVAAIPELKESEDERMIKFISNELACLRAVDEKGSDRYEELTNAIAWIGKQGEQKPTYKIEPKFKVGDWIYHEISENIIHINKIENGLYVSDEGATLSFGRQDDWRLWTIQDAKDGDVLREDSCTFIIERMKPDGTATIHCCLFDDGDFELGSNLIFDVYSTYPATKEQRDLLFLKMKEAGYEWDSGKKELRKIEQTPAAYFYCKYGGTIPKCSGCIRNHLNSKYKTEEIKTWMTPASRGTKQCSDYIPKDSVK